jgi:hypothetical protein
MDIHIHVDMCIYRHIDTCEFHMAILQAGLCKKVELPAVVAVRVQVSTLPFRPVLEA